MKLYDLKIINRLVIYFFYDKFGIVDNYVLNMLKDIRQNCVNLVFVSNGELESTSKEKLLEFTNNIIERDNTGFDVWAYKDGISYVGWDEIVKYDEVIFMNHTIMGPLYSTSIMFDEMKKRDVDFWGITTYHKMEHDPFGCCEYGYIPKHLQSHFIAVRKKMLNSSFFKEYWDARPMINNYSEAICHHEAIFTKKFEEKGFLWESYVDTTDMEKHNYYPLILSPVKLIVEKRCPIFKRRSFFHNYDELLSISNGNQGSDLMDYLKNHTDYDVDMIWENILRLENMADIKKSLHLNYILPTNQELKLYDKKKIALVIHIYFEDLIDYCYKYALPMPYYSDIYITTDTEEKKCLIEAAFSKGNWNSVQVLLIKNRGRDVSALLTGSKLFIMDYDYVCFMHDKKVTQLNYGLKGEGFSYQCFENNLKNNMYVNNIINLFNENPRLGLLTPPPPCHADYYPTISFEWGYNYEITKRLADNLGLKIDISPDKEPIAPLGTMFWFRPKSLKCLFDKNWTYNDFPPEPNETDGTLLHAIERIYPLVAQDEGYYSAWIMSDSFAKIEITNLYYMLSEVNKVAFQLYGFNSHYGLVSTMKYSLLQNLNSGKRETDLLFKKLLKEKAKSIIPVSIWAVMKKVYHFFGGRKWVC